MAQRHISAIIAFFAVLIVQHGMAVRERAAAGIFTGNAHRRAFGHQACISDGFGHAPINRLLAGGHGLATQGGLGLPERDFYFNPEAGVVKIRADYVEHIARTFVLLGREPKAAKAAAEQVMAFETALAKASRKLEDLRDPE